MFAPFALFVVIVVDQFRTDELLKAPHLNPSGFNLFLKDGVFYDDAHHEQFFNMTCPGHVAISTGAKPGLTGVMLNDDWDGKNRKPVYCVADQAHQWLKAGADNQNKNIGTSAKRILVSTVGDEMKSQWGSDTKVISVSVKDRSAIALGGHGPDGAYWFAPKSRIWTTSDAYNRTGDLPSWLNAYNKSRPIPAEKFEEDYENSERSISDTTDIALLAAKSEKLGLHQNPDILWISYSTHDYVGHSKGDNSPELGQTLVAEDKNVSKLLTELKKQLGGKRIFVVLTADHGAGVNIDEGQKVGLPGGRLNSKETSTKLAECLKKDGIQLDHLANSSVYLAPDTKDIQNARVKAKECLSQSPGIWSAFTREEVLAHQIPQVPWLRNLESSFNPERGPDVIAVLKPYWNSSDNHVLNHETPYDYDSWVPLGFWWTGVTKHKIHRRVSVTSLAPTLARILKVRRPSGSMDEYLTEILDLQPGL